MKDYGRRYLQDLGKEGEKMIIAERKPIKDLVNMLEPYEKICILGCGTCVTVCLAGGEKEVQETAATIKLHRQQTGRPVSITTKTIERQCEYEFVDEALAELKDYDVILSLGCGVGVQTIASRLQDKPVLPGLNTISMGMPQEQGVWTEYCLGCGDCVLDRTYGICPITRCAKSLQNGPCGGSQDGKCEISKETDCAWHLIIERLTRLGKLDLLKEIQPPKDWSKAHSGHGPRKTVREDVRL